MLNHIRETLSDQDVDHIDGDYPDAAVLMAFTDDEDPRLILTVRASDLSSHAGEVAFPGGKRDDTDESLLHTALRETEEEIAIEPALVDVIGRSTQRISFWGLRVTPFVGVVPADIRLNPNPREIEEIFQVPLGHLLDPNNLNMTPRTRDGVEYLVPNFSYKDYSVWGLTAVMIVDLLNAVFDYGLDLQRWP